MNDGCSICKSGGAGGDAAAPSPVVRRARSWVSKPIVESTGAAFSRYITTELGGGETLQIPGDAAGGLYLALDWTPNAGVMAKKGAQANIYGVIRGGSRHLLGTGYYNPTLGAGVLPIATISGLGFDWYEIDLSVAGGSARVQATATGVAAGGAPLVRIASAAAVRPTTAFGDGFVVPLPQPSFTDQFPIASPPTDADGNWTTTRVGAYTLAWDPTVGTGVWRRVIAGPGGSMQTIDSPATTLSSPAAVVVGVAAAPLFGVATPTQKAVLIQADPANAAPVYVGAAGVAVATGIALVASDSITIEVADAASVYAIAGIAGQKLRVLVQ